MTTTQTPTWSRAGISFSPSLSRFGRVYVASADGELAALRPADGVALWTHQAADIHGPILERNGVLFVTSFFIQPQTEGETNVQRTTVLAVDAESGVLVWSREIAGWSRDAYALQGDALIVAADPDESNKVNGVIHCFAALDGTPRWTATGLVGASDFFLTPVRYKESVLIATVGRRELLCLDPGTGMVRWKRTLEREPWLLHVDGDVLYVTLANRLNDPPTVPGRVAAYRAETGDPIWSVPVDGPDVGGLAVGEFYVYAGVGQVNFTGPGKARVVALRKDTGVVVWEHVFGNDAPEEMALHGGRLYVPMRQRGKSAFNDPRDPRLFVLDAMTGHALAYAPLGQLGLWCRADDDAFYVGEFDFTVIRYDAHFRWRASLGAASRSGPAVAGGLVLCGTEKGLVHARRTDTGAAVWTFDCGKPVEASPRIDDGVVFVGALDGRFRALRLDSGALQWTFEARGPITGSAAVTESLALFGSRDNSLYALDRTNGQKRWEFPTGGFVDGTPVVADELVLFGSADGTLYATDLAGVERWRFATLGEIKGRVLVTEDAVVFGNSDGFAFCLALADGTERWRRKLDGPLTFSAPVRRLDAAWVGTEGTNASPGKLHLLALADGEVRASSPPLGRITARPARLRQRLYVADHSGRWHVLSAIDGHLERSVALKAPVFASPAVDAHGALYVCDTNGELVSLLP